MNRIIRHSNDYANIMERSHFKRVGVNYMRSVQKIRAHSRVDVPM